MYVYILRSLTVLDQRYIGLTNDLKRRLAEHNSGKNFHTQRYLPWKLALAVWFEDSNKAARFERYLKSGSGLAFRMRHF